MMAKTIKIIFGDYFNPPILESLPVAKKNRNIILQKAAVAISDHTTYRQGSTEGCGRFPEMWLASIPKVIWCWSKDLRELWS